MLTLWAQLEPFSTLRYPGQLLGSLRRSRPELSSAVLLAFTRRLAQWWGTHEERAEVRSLPGWVSAQWAQEQPADPALPLEGIPTSALARLEREQRQARAAGDWGKGTAGKGRKGDRP